jgi:hypothetical protein
MKTADYKLYKKIPSKIKLKFIRVKFCKRTKFFLYSYENFEQLHKVLEEKSKLIK